MKQALRIALSIGISFAIIGLLLQAVSTGVSDQERPGVVTALQQTAPSLIVAYLLIYLVTLLVRAHRYRVLLIMAGETNVPTRRQMALVTGIRNMVVDMLPARIGELGYVGLLNRGYGVRLEHCVSSLTISIAFDLIALMVIAVLIIAKQLFAGGVEAWALGALVSALVISAVAIVGLFVITPTVNRWLNDRFPQQSQKPTWVGRGFQLLDQFSNSLVTVRQAGRSTEVLGLSVLIRLMKYSGFYLLFVAVSAASFPQLAQLPVEKVVSALIGGELGASLPIPTFMSFGTYEAGSTLVFSLLGVADQAAAVITMLCVHIWSQVVDYLIGGALLVLFIWLVRRSKRTQSDASAAGTSSWAKAGLLGGAAFVLLAGSGLLAWELRAAKKMGAINAPESGQAAQGALQGRDLSKQLVRQIDGFVVFSSNRDGNHDIFKLELSDFSLHKVTDHPHTETYPRVSPNGQRLIFARAHQPWVSQRNTVAWDVYLKDLNSGDETLIGRNGTAPHWLNDAEIIYLQNATRVVRVNVDSNVSKKIYEGGDGNRLPVGTQLQNPKLNPTTGQLVFTARQSQIGISSGHWGTAIAKGEEHRGLYNGCEIAWTSDGASLYQVNPGGRFNDLQIIRIDPETFATSTLIDLEGEFSHEYWPKDSFNGEYMVFGASRSPQEHEHDTEDYEIFLWRVGSDPGQATRLTFHTGNDNWPDVHIR